MSDRGLRLQFDGVLKQNKELRRDGRESIARRMGLTPGGTRLLVDRYEPEFKPDASVWFAATVRRWLHDQYAGGFDSTGRMPDGRHPTCRIAVCERRADRI